MAKKTKKQSDKNCKSTKHSKKSKKNSSSNQKLSDFSFADLVLISATLAYSISEELDDNDLSIFLVFLEMLVIDMQAIIVQRQIRGNNNTIDNEDLIDDEEDIDIE